MCSGQLHRICDIDREKAEAFQEQFLPELVYRGIATACFVVGRCLQLGQGIEKSDMKAKEYFDKVSVYLLLSYETLSILPNYIV